MTQICVAPQPVNEVNEASTELAQHLESPSSAIAQTSDRFTSDIAEALLPLEEIAIASELAQDHEQQPDTTAPFKFDDKVLAGFTLANRSNAVFNAIKTLRGGATATEAILQIATWIQEMKSGLSRKEFGAFVKQLLQWGRDEARKYLDIARAFEGFGNLARLQHLEPFTLLKLRSQKYSPVVQRLRESALITPKLIQELVKELLPKQSRKKPSEPISGWKQNRAGGGRRYEVILHDEQTGLAIEQQAEAEGTLPHKVLAEAVALRAKHKAGSVLISGYRAAQLEEFPTVIEHTRTLEREKRGLELELERRDRTIVELEAKLTGRALSSAEMCSEGLTGLDVEQELEPTQGAEPEFLAHLHSIGDGLEAQVEQTAEPKATNYSEPEQKSSYLEPVCCESTRLVERQDNAQNLEAEHNTVLKEGDLVEINVTRPNGDKTWNGSRAYIQNFVTDTGKVAVLLQGDYRSKQFLNNELSLVEPVEEKRQTSAVPDSIDECPPFTNIETEARPDIADSSDAQSKASTIILTETGEEVFAEPSPELEMAAWQKQQPNRKLQPVEILTASGEWVGGYFVHSCIAVANLVNTERQFTLFDADGEMCRFFGQIRPLRGDATKQQNVRQ